MIALLLAILLQLPNGSVFVPPRLKTVVPPNPPLNVIIGNTVLSAASISSRGDVQQVVVKQGVVPFVDASTKAVKQWKFEPAMNNKHAAASTVGVLTIFRAAAFGTESVGGPQFGFKDPRPGKGDHPPMPRSISDPGYPSDSVGEGVVVLELMVGPDGGISDVRTVNDVPSLTAPTVQAVRSWQLIPAVKSGHAVQGRLIVVVSFLRPII